MKILFTVHYQPPRHQAGTEIYTASLAGALARRGHEVTVLCREDVPREECVAMESTTAGGVRKITLNIPARPRRYFPAPWNFRYQFSNPAVSSRVTRLFEDISPDILHVQHLLGLSTDIVSRAHSRGIPILFTLNDYWYLCHRIRLSRGDAGVCSGPLHGLRCARCRGERAGPSARSLLLAPGRLPFLLHRNLLMKRILGMGDLLLAPSEFLGKRYVEWGIPHERIVISDYGFEDHGGDRISGMKEMPGESSRGTRGFTVGFVGTITRHKGVHVAIDAFQEAMVDRSRLLIFGHPEVDPPYTAVLREGLRSPNVRFMGGFDNAEVRRVFGMIDLLVVPSLWAENSPLVIHEAFLHGTPVLASDIGGIPELVRRGVSGELFRAGDARDLAVKLRRFITDPDYYSTIRARIPPVKTIAGNAEELEELYVRLYDGR